MTIIVRGKNVEITPALRDYVEKRLGKISKYFENIGEINTLLVVEKGRHIVEVTVQINGMLLRGEEETPDMYTSIDLVVEKLERQIDKYKTKLARKVRTTAAFKNEFTARVEEEEGQVVKTKTFMMKPMDVEEAMLQLNLINHDFFVFRNSDTEQVNVLYRRKDGNYGLIEPAH